MYNKKISARANASLAKRARIVSLQKRMLAFAIILVIAVLVLLGSSIRAFASSKAAEVPKYKYYTSIQVEKGDSLWSIANDYAVDGVMDREDFIDEVCSLNHISEKDVLRSGDHLVVVYYSDEKK
jgi:cell division protein YceG involved in septum cleavage